MTEFRMVDMEDTQATASSIDALAVTCPMRCASPLKQVIESWTVFGVRSTSTDGSRAWLVSASLKTRAGMGGFVLSMPAEFAS